MNELVILTTVALVGLFTTSAVIIGTTLGLYVHTPRNVLGGVLAFAAGVLVSSLGIEHGFRVALDLRERGFATLFAWAFVSSGFATGATIYYTASRFLDRRGAAVRSATRFREYVLERKQEDIQLLSRCDLLRHLPPQAIEELLEHVREVHVGAGEIIFRAGDIGDALYLIAHGRVVVLHPHGGSDDVLAELSEGHVFGEMALLTDAPRSATLRAETETDLLRIDKEDFDRLVASDHEIAMGAQRMSHSRAISNLAAGRTDPAKWAKIANSSLERLSRRETEKLLAEAGHGAGAGFAIILSDLLDTIPGLLVVGAKFTNLRTLALTVMVGIFIGGIPKSAASATFLRKAGFGPRAIYRFWSISVVAGVLSAVFGKAFLSGSESLVAVFVEAMAGGSLLALVSHAMIPEALNQAGSLVVLPTVAGFLFALYLILAQTAV